MTQVFKTVDLFAGPGGLAEGFSAIRGSDGKRVFDIALSVEKEASAFATLRLRSFVRQFNHIPDTYYRYLSGTISKDELTATHPVEWQAAPEIAAYMITTQLETAGIFFIRNISVFCNVSILSPL